MNCPNCNHEVSLQFNFCPNCGNGLKTVSICPKCKTENETGAKFCRECGNALLKKEKGKAEAISFDIPAPPATGITIEFKYTTSSSFDFAIAEARKISTFEQFGEDKKAIFRVNFQQKEIFKAVPLLEQMKGWRNRIVYLDGLKVTWESVFSFSWCYEKKLSSFNPGHYCFGVNNEWDFNIWGCLQSRMNFQSHAEWFTYGKWLNNKGDWQFDKERIKHELTNNLYEYRFFPAFDVEFVKDILQELPEIVNPTKDKDWQFIESYQPASNFLAVTKKDYGFEQTIYYKGVGPNGLGFIQKLSDRFKKRIPLM